MTDATAKLSDNASSAYQTALTRFRQRIRTRSGRRNYTILFVISAVLILSSFTIEKAGPISIGLLIGGIMLAFNTIYYLVAPMTARVEGRRLNLLIELINSGLEPTILTGRDGHYLHANSAYRNLFTKPGATPPPPTELPVADGNANVVFRTLMATAAETGIASQEVHLALYGNEPRTYRVTATWLHRGPDLVVWRLDDISPARTMEELLEEARQAVADHMEDAGFGYCSISGDGAVETLNGLLATWIGRPAADIIQAPTMVGDLFEDGGAMQFARAVSAAVEGKPSTIRVNLHSENGEPMPVLVSPKPRWDPYGRLYGAGAVIRDAREMDTVVPETPLPTAEARFTRLFADAPVGIALIEKSGVIVEANRTFASIVGVPSAEIAGMTFPELLEGEDRRGAQEILSVAFDPAATPSIRDVTFRLDKPEHTAQMIARGLEDDGAGDPAAIVYLLDVTEQKNLELRFAQSQKMDAVGQLAGGVAHDFNNLLTAIMGFTDLLLARHGPGDPSFADIMQIQQNSKRATNLVRQLLAFSRQQTLHPKILNVTDVIAELSHLLRRLLGATIELNVVHGRNLGYVKVDQGQLEQVITNLAVNSRDAMPSGGTLTIRTANVSAEESAALGHDLMPPADYVLIEVADTGCGIPREKLGQIFEPFFTTKETGKGTGLGLSTVYGIVKQTGGFIFPESEVDKGTTFRLYLPVHVATEEEQAEADKPKTTAPVKDLTGKARVLLVEDEDAVRMFASRALKSKGYTVFEAESGVKALEMLDEEGIDVDLIVSDVVMPQMDGPTLIKRLRETRKDLKIIFISGYAEDAFRKNLDAKNVNFLPKPFSLKQLAEKVKDVLEE